MQKPKATATVVLGIFISVMTIVGGAYGFTAWMCRRLDERVDERVDTRLEYLHIKFDVLMTPDQKRLAYQIWKQYKEERGIE
ncbi:MAG: hypothetical protein KKD77_21500 [Gammaproteobacteria bacterium]|nr:hypothetical protein [Gammaproteobacteria bacterium]